MIRVFLKLYLLLVLPLVLMTMLPQSPLNILGSWWFEKQAYREYGAIYSLVKEELDLVPQSQWVDKVSSISKHFAYPLFLKTKEETSLSQNIHKKLKDQGYALITHNLNSTLIFPVTGSDFILYTSLYSRTTRQEEFEKDTRGYRYFLNKRIKESVDPVKEFETTTKKYFSVELKMHTVKDFKKTQGNSAVVSKLLERDFYVDYDQSDKAYLMSDDKKYIVVIKNGNRKAEYRRYSNLLSFIVPALLLAIGVLIWITLFKKDFKKVNIHSKEFGAGNLNTRINLSKNSALYPISHSFNQMADRIQNLISSQRELTNAVSHELKTPISRLHYALELQKASQTKNERDEYTRKIENNITSLETLVAELLSYTRLETKQILNITSQKLKPWLKKELDSFSEYHPIVDIIFNSEDNNQSVHFDALMLSRAMTNLLENAAYYANKKNPIIRVTATIKEGKSNIVVEDNGSGISKANYKKVFEPFTRLDPSRQRNDNNKSLGGYGMGLSIVKKIMLQHNGDISCSKSDLGGAKFSLVWDGS